MSMVDRTQCVEENETIVAWSRGPRNGNPNRILYFCYFVGFALAAHTPTHTCMRHSVQLDAGFRFCFCFGKNIFPNILSTRAHLSRAKRLE